MMSRTMAEAQLPKRVDAVKLVNGNQRLNAKIDAQNLPRLQEAVLECTAPVTCEIEFHQDQEKHRLVTGNCNTKVVMTCQRCLEGVEVPVESRFQLGLVLNDEQARQLPKQLEPVELEEDGYLDLWTVLEDEVLLALPMFPTHHNETCQPKQPEPKTTNSNIKRPSPFDVLAKLK